jgi:hypothetical protein
MADIIKTVKLDQMIPALVPPIPGAVTGLTITATTPAIVELSWMDLGLFAEQYEIEYGTDATFGVKTTILIPAHPNSSTLEEITGLNLRAATHYFRVRAKSGGGDSAWVSDSYTAPVPAAVINLNVIPLMSGTDAQAEFDDPGMWPTNYEIQVDDDPAFGSPVINTNIAANPNGFTSHSLAGLTASTTYYIRIRAYYGAVYSAYTSGSFATP